MPRYRRIRASSRSRSRWTLRTTSLPIRPLLRISISVARSASIRSLRIAPYSRPAPPPPPGPPPHGARPPAEGRHVLGEAARVALAQRPQRLLRRSLLLEL